MHKIYELKDMLCEELEEYAGKDKLDVGGLDIIDKLAHTIKNLNKIIEAYEEEEEYSGAYDMGGSYERGMSRRSYARGGNSNRSYARRSMAQNRDAIGRYSRDGEMIDQLRSLAEDAQDEQMRSEIHKLIRKMERM